MFKTMINKENHKVEKNIFLPKTKRKSHKGRNQRKAYKKIIKKFK